MVRHTFKILQHLLQDFLSVSDHFGPLCIQVLTTKTTPNPKKTTKTLERVANFIFPYAEQL